MTNLKEEREAIAEFIAESKLSRMETAMKVRELLLSHEEKVRDERDTYWKERVRKEVEGIKEKYSRRELQQGGYSQACDDILQVLDNLK